MTKKTHYLEAVILSERENGKKREERSMRKEGRKKKELRIKNRNGGRKAGRKRKNNKPALWSF